jgi:peptide methionine sulfoxide reductase MsrB
MSKKSHGSCEKPVQQTLKWNCDVETADRICCFNRHYAEHKRYWESTNFLKDIKEEEETIFYDSVTGKSLFIAPKGRSFNDFKVESQQHGWPSFRDEEVIWANVRCLTNGETVSTDGTHLGHNIPDKKGNRYCINLVSIAGNKIE